MAVLARGREKLRLRGMPGIRRIVVVRLMASDTSGGQRRVIAIHMTVAAVRRRDFVRAGKGEGGVVVIKG